MKQRARRGFPLGSALSLALSLALFAPALSATLIAERMTPENVARLQQHGPDAIGGVGDWHLSNGTLCATVSDVAHESDMSARGGVLVDLGYCGRADDQFSSMQDLLNGSTANPVNVYRVEILRGEHSVGLRTFGGDHGLEVETVYQFKADDPYRLHISKRVRRTRDSAPEFFIYVPIFFNYHTLQTFVFSSLNPQNSTGFIQQRFHDQSTTSFGRAARNADVMIAIGAKDAMVPIAYGWQQHSVRKRAADGVTTALPTFLLSDVGSTARMIAADTFYLDGGGELGMAQLAQLPLLGAEPGEAIEIEESIYVGSSDTVDAVLRKIQPGLPEVRGRVSQPGVGVHLDLADGTPHNFTRANADGEFALAAQPGDYQLRVLGLADTTHTQAVTLTAQGTMIGTIALPEPAWIELPQGEPMRLVFKGNANTTDPHFEDTFTGAESWIGDEPDPRGGEPRVPAVFLAGIDSDLRRVPVAPGHYTVYATRGIEHELSQSQIVAEAGTTQRLALAPPERAVATPGYIAADMHVHSAPSMDNGFSVRERVRTFVAEFGEVMVAAEHENLYDFGPLIRDMGVEHRMVSITGTEMTSQVPHPRMPHTTGHANFFPMVPDPAAYRRGVPANEGRRLREILNDLNTRAPNAIRQINHARESDRFLDLSAEEVEDQLGEIGNGALFEHMGPAGYPYNPHQPLQSSPNNTLIEPDPVTGTRDLDVDAFEVLNGPHGYSPTRRRALLADWLSLLSQGERMTGTANSDSHNKAQQVGLPRNMVQVADDRIEAFDQDAFLAAVRQGRVYGTTGPLLSLNLSGVGIGGTHRGEKGQLAVEVRRASWIPADEVRVRVNGSIVESAPLPAHGRVTFDLNFTRDSHVVVEVEGAPTALYQTLYPRQVPYAFSNPIYVDADVDGEWTPPGLSSR